MVGKTSNKTGWYRCTLPNNEGLIWYKNFERNIEFGLTGDGKTFGFYSGGLENVDETMYESEPTEEEKYKINKEIFTKFFRINKIK